MSTSPTNKRRMSMTGSFTFQSEGHAQATDMANAQDAVNGNRFALLSAELDNINNAADMDKRKLKKKIKKAHKISSSVPQLTPNFESLRNKKNNTLKLRDWQNLVLFLLTDDAVNPSWILVKNRQSVQKVLVLMVNGLHPDDVLPSFKISDAVFCPPQAMPTCSSVPSFKKLPFQQAIVTTGPGEKTHLYSATTSFLQVPLTAKQKLERKNKTGKKKGYVNILTVEELKRNEYPLRHKGEPLPEGWVDTATDELLESIQIDYHPSEVDQDGFTMVGNKQKSKDVIYAVDCEMCVTKLGLELTRVTLMEQVDHTVIYDTLVKPQNPIIDHNTKYSGITAEMMENVTKTLSDCQKELLEIIKHDTVLLGHSLENDLKALKMFHRKILDTSVMFHSSRGPPHKPSLKWLAQRFLNKMIQLNSEGHDSVEDARTCLELYELKKFKGHDFGLSAEETESIFSRLQSAGRKCAMVDREKTIKQCGRDANVQLPCETDLDAVELTLQALVEQNCDFVYTRIRALENNQELPWINTDYSMEEIVQETLDRDNGFPRLNAVIKDIIDVVPNNTLVILLSGHGNAATASKLLADRRDYMKLTSEIGTIQVHEKHKDKVFGQHEMGLLEQAVKDGRVGVGMYGMKVMKEVDLKTF